MALINMGAGLSSMGAAISQQAGAYGLAQQKAELENQQTMLANSLAGQRESVGRAETAGYAATAAGKQQTFETGLETQRETSAAALAKGQQASSEKISAGQQATEKEVAGIDVTSAAALAKGQQASSEKIAAGQQATEKEVAGIDVTARSADVKAQIEAAGNQMGFDTNGNPQIINAVTGKVTPLVGPDGKPISAMNPAMIQFAMKTMQDATQSLGQARIQYASDVRAAQDTVAKVLQTHLNLNDPAVVAAQRNLQDVKNSYAPMFANYNRQISNAAALLKGPQNEAAPPAASAAKAADFDKTPTVTTPGGDAAPAPGLLNTPP